MSKISPLTRIELKTREHNRSTSINNHNRQVPTHQETALDNINTSSCKLPTTRRNKVSGNLSILSLSYKLLSLLCLFTSSVKCFGWTAWNQNALQSIGDCPTFDGNRTGICVTSAAECRNRGGRRLGSCYSNQGGINAQNYQYGGQSGYGPFFGGPGLGIAVGVCCSSKYISGSKLSDYSHKRI